MRIAMISEHASPLAALGGEDAGGQNTHVAELSAALVRAGHDVRVYTRRDSLGLPAVAPTREQVTVVHVPAGPPEPIPKDTMLPYMPEFGRWLAATWRSGDWQPDVLHAHFWMSGLAAVAAGRQLGLPVVLTYHALGTVKRRHQGGRDTSPARRLEDERTLGRTVDRVIAQSRDEVRELVRMGVPRERISIVPSGVNLAAFTPYGPMAARTGARPRILSVGRLVRRKGFQDLIRAIRSVPEVECVIVGGPPQDRLGEDPQARVLLTLAESCGVADRVRLTGAVPREEMPLWYRSADLVVATPWYEPFGLTPLEAMACGVPVIGSAVGGIIDTVADGRTGELVPPRDPQALAAAIGRLLTDDERRSAYSIAALERVRHGYSWQRAADRLVDVYTAVVAVGRPTRAVV